jgi:hypothetical protein
MTHACLQSRGIYPAQKHATRRALRPQSANRVLDTTDLERSQDFHENKVGLRLSPVTIKNSLVFECGDSTTLLVYGRPSPNEADHTRPADSP